MRFTSLIAFQPSAIHFCFLCSSLLFASVLTTHLTTTRYLIVHALKSFPANVKPHCLSFTVFSAHLATVYCCCTRSEILSVCPLLLSQLMFELNWINWPHKSKLFKLLIQLQTDIHISDESLATICLANLLSYKPLSLMPPLFNNMLAYSKKVL